MSVRTFCRLKPPATSSLVVRGNSLSIKSYNFDFELVFPDNASQKDVFDLSLDPTIQGVIQGTSGAVVLFGPSGSGKSFTLRGGEGKNKGMLFRSAEKILIDVDRLQSLGKNIELKLSIFQIYQDIITDLMVFGSRGLSVIEKDEQNLIESLTEHPISNFSDFKSHLHHSFQVRKTILKPDPNLKLKSHYVAFFSLYEDSNPYSKLALIELAGSENASNDQSIIKSNSLTIDEKKSIARSFNALSAVLNGEQLWQESSLTLSCKSVLQGNVALICTIPYDSSVLKHSLASLKFIKRLREGTSRRQVKFQQDLRDDLQQIRNDLKEARFITNDWAEIRLDALKRIEELIISGKNAIGSPKECDEFLIECNIFRKQIQALLLKSVPPINRESLRRRSASPINEDNTTDRDIYLRQKISTLQSHNESQLHKIEELSHQVSNRNIEVKDLHKHISDLERTVFEKDKIIQDFEAKLSDANQKINDYVKRFKLMKDQSAKSINQAIGAREEVLENQILALEKVLDNERIDHSTQIQKLQQNLQYKERVISELQSSSSNCLYEKESAIQDIKSKIKHKSTIISDLEKQVNTLTNSYNEAKFKMDVYLASSKKFEEECEGLRKRIEELSARHVSAEGKNLLLSQKAENLDKELNSARQEIDSRKYKSQQLSASLKEMENTMFISSEELQRLKFELGQLKSENQLLRIEKDNADTENFDLREENNMIKAELRTLSGQVEETNNYLKEKELVLQGIRKEDPGSPKIQKKSTKIKELKDQVALLQQQLRECQIVAEEEIKRALDERDATLQEYEECKGGQIHELSLVEDQVGQIEEQLIKLKEQNKQLVLRENEMCRELRNSEAGKEKYKEMVVELKEEIRMLQGQLAEMDEFAKEYIEGVRKEVKDMRIDDEKALVLKSRIRAVHDVKNLIQAHRIQR